METKHIHISDYNYDLPDSRIAKIPVSPRDTSKLLVYRHGEISDDIFYNLPKYLPEKSLMVFNNTKVIQARMHFRKETGALIEVFLMEPAAPTDYELMFQTRGECSWLCMVGNLKKWKEGSLVRTFDVAGKIGVFDVYATYYNIDAENDSVTEYKAATATAPAVDAAVGAYPALDQEIYVVGASTKVAKDLKLSAEWLHGKSDIDEWKGDKDGYTVGLAYKGAKAAKAGSWGLYANYFDQPQATYVKHTITGYTALPAWAQVTSTTDATLKNFADGFKGYEVGANYAFAKNIVGTVRYYDLEAREGTAKDVRTLWSEVVFTF